MNDSQLAALVPESEDYATNWYRRFARHPFFEPLGVNSGVMLMNLTRMRAFGWESLMGPLLTKYERNISWGDQDLINIVFHDHPGKLLVLSCKWNFRTDHCMYGPNCLGATAALLHGNRNVFQTSKEPAFRAVYLAMQQYQLGSSLLTGFLDPLEKGLRKARTTRCGQELLGHLAQWRERQLL
ncbi:glucoside xylosyltransferase 1 [Ixodes scapularis]